LHQARQRVHDIEVADAALLGLGGFHAFPSGRAAPWPPRTLEVGMLDRLARPAAGSAIGRGGGVNRRRHCQQ
jgi:hypothetical protein